MAAAEFAATAMSNGDAAAGVPMQEELDRLGLRIRRRNPRSSWASGVVSGSSRLAEKRESLPPLSRRPGGRDGTEPS